MKNALFLLVALFLSTAAFADNAPSAPAPSDPAPTVRDLQAVMHDMGAVFKVLGSQISDPTKNATSITAAASLNSLIGEASAMYPDQLAALPADQQRAQQLQYLRAILNLRVTSIDLEEALTAGNQQAGQDALTKLGQIKTDGHNQFKQD